MIWRGPTPHNHTWVYSYVMLFNAIFSYIFCSLLAVSAFTFSVCFKCAQRTTRWKIELELFLLYFFVSFTSIKLIGGTKEKIEFEIFLFVNSHTNTANYTLNRSDSNHQFPFRQKAVYWIDSIVLFCLTFQH